MIRVLNNYGGRNTNEQRILPGDYAADDPRLFGLAEYLVQHGHAVVVVDAAPLLPDADDPPVFAPVATFSAPVAIETVYTAPVEDDVPADTAPFTPPSALSGVPSKPAPKRK